MSDPAKAVFLSYAREDIGAVRRIADALRGFGIEVWFDVNELRGGDAWDAKIKKQIHDCALFVPIVSASTQARAEGYFRREWSLGVDRTRDMAASRAFITPVVIDDTRPDEAEVPEEFLRYQWTHLPHGAPTPQFVDQVKGLLEKPHAPGRSSGTGAHSSSIHRSEAAPRQKRKPAPLAVVGAAVAVAFVAVAYFALRPAADSPAKSPPVAGQPSAAAPSQSPSAGAQPPMDFASAKSTSAKSIAVLPFTNMSDEKDSAYFSDGSMKTFSRILR
ncbi:MAG: TIR domain-containing protein [Verrucomicrobia bacterium]|nr:TIR domain-containing protein [Verrucomicrobiota bacterium]